MPSSSWRFFRYDGLAGNSQVCHLLSPFALFSAVVLYGGLAVVWCLVTASFFTNSQIFPANPLDSIPAAFDEDDDGRWSMVDGREWNGRPWRRHLIDADSRPSWKRCIEIKCFGWFAMRIMKKEHRSTEREPASPQ